MSLIHCKCDKLCNNSQFGPKLFFLCYMLCMTVIVISEFGLILILFNLLSRTNVFFSLQTFYYLPMDKIDPKFCIYKMCRDHLRDPKFVFVDDRHQLFKCSRNPIGTPKLRSLQTCGCCSNFVVNNILFDFILGDFFGGLGGWVQLYIFKKMTKNSNVNKNDIFQPIY